MRGRARVREERDGVVLLNCSRCDQMKAEDAFLADERYTHGRRSWCQSCYSDYRRSRRHIAIKQERRHKLGISIEDQDAMWEKQDGRCASCSSAITLNGAHLDHDHATGRVRAFLCGPCNHIVGRCEEDVDRLVAVAEYLIQQGRS